MAVPPVKMSFARLTIATAPRGTAVTVVVSLLDGSSGLVAVTVRVPASVGAP
jgi:hypothetical protein